MDATRFADLAKSLAWQLGELRHETWAAELPSGSTYGTLAGGTRGWGCPGAAGRTG